MLRWMLALVVMANLLFLAWSQHWLAPLGLGPVSQREPQRLQQQVRPEAIVLRPAPSGDSVAVSSGERASAVTAASAPDTEASAAGR
ncbi:MAG: hypothetical protein ACK5NE_02455 [Brachymonas sp.]